MGLFRYRLGAKPTPSKAEEQPRHKILVDFYEDEPIGNAYKRILDDPVRQRMDYKADCIGPLGDLDECKRAALLGDLYRQHEEDDPDAAAAGLPGADQVAFQGFPVQCQTCILHHYAPRSRRNVVVQPEPEPEPTVRPVRVRRGLLGRIRSGEITPEQAEAMSSEDPDEPPEEKAQEGDPENLLESRNGSSEAEEEHVPPPENFFSTKMGKPREFDWKEDHPEVPTEVPPSHPPAPPRSIMAAAQQIIKSRSPAPAVHGSGDDEHREAIQEDTAIPDERKAFPCPFEGCTRSFDTKAQLDGHIGWHRSQKAREATNEKKRKKREQKG